MQIQYNIYNLILSCFLAVNFTFCQSQEVATIKQLESIEFQQLIDSLDKDVQLIDVRTAAEFNEGHIKLSNNLNILDGTFEAAIGKLNPDAPILLYCKKGGRSSKAAQMCIDKGFKHVYELKGGYDSYP